MKKESVKLVGGQKVLVFIFYYLQWLHVFIYFASQYNADYFVYLFATSDAIYYA
jgi:hypothetical protein